MLRGCDAELAGIEERTRRSEKSGEFEILNSLRSEPARGCDWRQSGDAQAAAASQLRTGAARSEGMEEAEGPPRGR